MTKRAEFTMPTVTVTIEVPALLISYLEALLATGLYGCTVADVAHEIIAAELRRQVFDTKTLPRQWR